MTDIEEDPDLFLVRIHAPDLVDHVLGKDLENGAHHLETIKYVQHVDPDLPQAGLDRNQEAGLGLKVLKRWQKLSWNRKNW